VSYILFHYFVKETSYGGTGAMKYIYYVILISHIFLASIVLPLILFWFNKYSSLPNLRTGLQAASRTVQSAARNFK
jgi:uncharacterized membrane protein YozB (DUF420 family)